MVVDKTINKYDKKSNYDKIMHLLLKFITLLCASSIILIVIFIFYKGIKPFTSEYLINENMYKVDFVKFLFGKTWFINPNIYGVGFIIINTFYIVIISLIIASFISVITALFIARIAPRILAKAMTYVIEMLASIPSIIYGVFGVGFITKLVKNLSSLFGYQSAGGISTLTTIIVLSIMIIPTVTMISITSIKAVKNDIINGSLALGATNTQTNFKVVLVSAKSGIFSGIILGLGRALGEATAISMVIGNKGNGPTFNFFDTSRTLTSTILLGIKETTGLDYDIRFSVGIILIVIIIASNLLLNYIKKRMGNLQ
ncbi:MAG: phosphate ABC transporter permease subunit PstC [Bacilli bacterium]